MRLFLLTLTAIFSTVGLLSVVSSCGALPVRNEIWGESAVAIISGTIMGTNGSGVVAQKNSGPVSPVGLAHYLLYPLGQPAWAAIPACPALQDGACNGSDLIVFYDNCATNGVTGAGLWRTYMLYETPSPGDCANILANGFSAGVKASLVGEKVTRHFGITAAGDQINRRLAENGEIIHLYSDFPSGWQKEDVMGGVEVYFDDATTRRFVVKGLHVVPKAFSSGSLADVPADLDLGLEPLPFDKTLLTLWDHTINTPAQGDELFEIGPQPSFGTNGHPELENQGSNTTAPRDGDIVVEGNTVQMGGFIRTQYNLSQGIGVTFVTEPLVYGNSSCCWPISGKVRTYFDLNMKSPGLWEEITFQTECGKITYETSEGEAPLDRMYHCY